MAKVTKEEIIKKFKTIAPDKIILALEEKGFFVGLLKNGSTIKKEANNILEFSEVVKQSSVCWVDYIIYDLEKDAIKTAISMGFSEGLVANLLKNKRSGYEDYDTEAGIIMPAIIVEGFDVNLDPLLILIRKDLVLTLHTTEAKRFFRLRRYAETFMRKIKITSSAPDKVTTILIRIIDENNGRNFDHLREIEENADELSAKLADIKMSREKIGPRIHDMKHALITYLTGLWAVVDVLNTLRYGDPELLSDEPKLLSRLNGLASEVNIHIGLAEHLSEVLASGMEVLQSIYNNQLQILNNKLALLVAYLTVIGTAVLVPNTLGTILSNPVYALTPADALWFNLLMIGSTVLATLASYWWVKKRGLIPERVD